MTRRDWYVGVVIVGFAIVLHAAIPRYEWRPGQGTTLVRIDRWRGLAETGRFAGGQWQAARELARQAAAAAARAATAPAAEKIATREDVNLPTPDAPKPPCGPKHHPLTEAEQVRGLCDPKLE